MYYLAAFHLNRAMLLSIVYFLVSKKPFVVNLTFIVTSLGMVVVVILKIGVCSVLLPTMLFLSLWICQLQHC